jgi:hypothetical protein
MNEETKGYNEVFRKFFSITYISSTKGIISSLVIHMIKKNRTIIKGKV